MLKMSINPEEYQELLEKNKELTCLYGIARLILESEQPYADKLQAIAELLAPAFQFPEQVQIHIRLDHHTYQTPAFGQVKFKISKKVMVHEQVRGCVEIGYPESRAAGPPKRLLLSKERKLLRTVARHMAYKMERRELKDHLMHADRLATIGQLAAGIAHELNNPLTDILGFAQLASNRPDLPEQTYRDLVRIVKSALYAREVIKKILIFSRQSLPRDSNADVNVIIREWMDFIEFRCAKNAIEVMLDLHADLPLIRVDAGQLSQVLVNLVINAIHAMPQGGRLTIRSGLQGDRIVFSVQDTGTGIREEWLDKIFLPFFTTKEVDQGTGLGLPVVYGIVQEHDGTVTVTSREGKGSTFEITFPLAPTQEGSS